MKRIVAAACAALLWSGEARAMRAANGIWGAPGPVTLYASASGSGLACTAGTPCSLATARAQAGGHGGTIYLVGSASTPFRLTSTVALTSADNGITYTAAVGSTPNVWGSVAITGWSTYSGSIQVATVPSGAHVASRQLWVNGVRAQRATTALSGLTANGTGFSGTNGISGWPDVLNTEVVGFNHWRLFRCPVSAVTSSQIAVATPCWTTANGAEMSGDVFSTVAFAENTLEGVTQAGEWYLDTTAWKLYYWPRPGDGSLSSADVEMPIVEQLVTITGATNVTWSGTTFSYGTWLHPSTTDGFVPVQGSYPFELQSSNANCTVTSTASSASNSCMTNALGNISVSQSANITLNGNTFSHMGGTGLALGPGTQGSLVDEAIVYDTSASGIALGDISHLTDQTGGVYAVSNNTIKRSFIHGTGMEYFSAPALQMGYTTGSVIENNEILDASYSGIMEGGFTNVTQSTSYPTYANNSYTYNLVQYAMSVMVDGGSLYSTGGMLSGSGSVFSFNVLSNQGAPYGTLYFDNWSQYKTASWNVFEIDDGIAYWLLVQSGAGLAKYNQVLDSYSNNSGTNGGIDSSNTVQTPTTISGIHDPQVSAYLAAAGTPLRTPDIAWGKSATASSTIATPYPGTTASANSAVNGSGRNLYRWDCAAGDSSPYWQVDLCTTQAGGFIAGCTGFPIDTVEVVGQFTEYTAGLVPVSYVVEVGNDAAFGSYTTVATKDSSSPVEYGGSVQFWPVSPAVTARYVRIASTAGACAAVNTYFGSLGFNQVRVHGS